MKPLARTRTYRCTDELHRDATEAARANGRDLSTVIRDALAREVKIAKWNAEKRERGSNG